MIRGTWESKGDQSSPHTRLEVLVSTQDPGPKTHPTGLDFTLEKNLWFTARPKTRKKKKVVENTNISY